MTTSDGAAASGHTHLTIMVFKAVQNLPLLAAEQQGLFRKYGLSVEIKIAPNSMELRDGLAAGRYQIVHTAVDNALAMVHGANIDVAVVMGGDDAFNAVYVQPDIQSYEDLRGKTVIVDALDTAFGVKLYALLARKGLQRGDYEVKSVGATYLRYQEMLNDKDAKAGMLHAPYSVLAERAGLRKLDVATEVVGPYQGTAAFVLRGWAEQNGAVVVRYLRAYIEGLRWALDPANRQEAIGLLMRAIDVPADVAAASYAVATDPQHGLARDAALDLEGFRNVLRIRAEFEGGTAAELPERYLDLSYYETALAELKATSAAPGA
jgi:ABC-type nitrate/sulfonate/bicarbonate transport system substrate-binding protein